MVDVIQANLLAFVAALLICTVLAWWLFARAIRKPERRERRPDVLDEGAAPAQRNQALIDALPAAAIVTTTAELAATGPDIMAGVGELVAVAAADEVEEANVAEEPRAQGDDLSRIKGLGPKLQVLLPTLGITTYAQIAVLTEADLTELDGRLGAFAGRPGRDNWVEQARLLAADDVAGFEAKFGKV